MWNYNTGANKRAREADKATQVHKIDAVGRAMFNHPHTVGAGVVAGVGAATGSMMGRKGAAAGGVAGAAIGGLASRYGRMGRVNAMHHGIRNPQLSLRHGFVEAHPNQSNAKTGIRTTTPSEVRSHSRVGKKI